MEKRMGKQIGNYISGTLSMFIGLVTCILVYDFCKCQTEVAKTILIISLVINMIVVLSETGKKKK